MPGCIIIIAVGAEPNGCAGGTTICVGIIGFTGVIGIITGIGTM